MPWQHGAMRRIAPVLAVLGVLATLLGAAPASAAPDAPSPTVSPGAGCDPRVYSSAFRTDLAARHGRGHDITAAVVDDRNGCRYELNPGPRITTASVFKLSVLGNLLRRAQAAGRGLTAYERSLVSPMIRRSADPPTNQLFSDLGGVPSFRQFYADIGMGSTTTSSGAWGLTTTTARDQTTLARRLLGGTLPGFTGGARAEAWEFTSTVDPSQDWGVTAGAAPGWGVGLKNGFYPTTCCRWRINTVGYARPPGGGAGLATAVLSHRWADDTPGIRAVEEVARHSNRLLMGDVGTDVPAGATPLAGDWNGDGFDTPAFHLDGRWWITDRAHEGPVTTSFTFGRPGDLPVVGDWDRDGRDEPAVVRGRAWFFRSGLAGGAADARIDYGRAGDQPVLGDWNGDGRDTPGVVRGKGWYLLNSVRGGSADDAFGFGRDGDTPITGDWDADGRDEPGLVRGRTWYQRYAANGGPAENTFAYGLSSDAPLSGRWLGYGVDGVGVLRGNQWYLRNGAWSGPADRAFVFGR